MECSIYHVIPIYVFLVCAEFEPRESRILRTELYLQPINDELSKARFFFFLFFDYLQGTGNFLYFQVIPPYLSS